MKDGRADGVSRNATYYIYTPVVAAENLNHQDSMRDCISTVHCSPITEGNSRVARVVHRTLV